MSKKNYRDLEGLVPLLWSDERECECDLVLEEEREELRCSFGADPHSRPNKRWKKCGFLGAMD